MQAEEESMEAFEARLRRLRPAAVPAAFETRLLSLGPEVSARGRRAASSLWLRAAAAAAAAALLNIGVFALLSRTEWLGPRAGTGPQPDCADLVVEPASGHLVSARDAGVWRGPDGRVYRVVQCLSVGQAFVRGAAADARVELWEPQRHVLLVAMRSQ